MSDPRGPVGAAGEPEDVVIAVAEETLAIGKRETATGRVRVSLTTETVEEILRETLLTRRAEVERVAVGREVSEIPQLRQEGDVLIVPVVEEILVVEKRLVLREEIRLRLVETEDVVELPAERRVQHATLERLPSPPETPDEALSTPQHQQGSNA